MNAREILDFANNCIQEEPVYCSAVCPMHVDVRLLMTHIQKGKFAEAARIYRSKVFFPGIISRTCEAPCQSSCLRNKIDEPLAIRRLEQACVTLAKGDKTFVSNGSRKNQHIAVVGGGLSGLSCSLELARKGFKVTVFEKAGRLGGRVWSLDAVTLPPDVIAEDLKIIEQTGISVELNIQVADLEQLACDAIYVATGQAGHHFGMEFAGDLVRYDPVSLASSREGVFVGGGIIRSLSGYAALDAVADGVRAARSIERYLQKASLVSGREGEGIRSTRLWTDIGDVQIQQAVAISEDNGQYTETEAKEEAARCLLCECKQCVKSCEFLEFFNQYPKKYILDISKTMTSLQGVRSKMIATRIINSCSLCGLCAEICPQQLDMGEVCLEARRALVAEDKIPPAFYDFWMRDMLFSSSPEQQLYRHQPGRNTSAYLFFPGCQLGASSPEYVEKTYSYLVANLNDGVGLALGCCGAPAEWSGNQALYKEHRQHFTNEWKQMGKPVVILACPTCQKMFSQYAKEIPIVSLWDIMQRNQLPSAINNGNGSSVAVYDPCSSRHNPDMQHSIRALLKRMNYQIEELPLHGKYAQCCSFGGLIAPINPELAQKIAQHRVNASPYNYVTYCVNCRDDFAGQGKPTWHILDMLFGNKVGELALRSAPTFTERRENRRRLKERLVELFWGEKMESDRPAYASVKLLVSAELMEKLNREYILLEEIQQVIYAAETSDGKLLDSETGHYIAHLQIGIVTYWVEYMSSAEETYSVYNAYSHRIQIQEEEK
ncbi:Thiamine thiazole synthase [Sporomusa silvacetica DSM 10669]|uniref:Thiamine thiazole synthase n=1 Tax=Sporomusa silvacetica DSM 10669 TaxID=1123289 RepID=A0ABZ3IKW8_9FIRM|nr:pyridine nucleotide-disulfide oxidoreductase/dicluster-binding protein [Sporomusa silvacetica]OZC22750.1 NADPH-Fe(3+) oxidoreductase subunit beta [Sporomusa silvacetica DSM 10669]